MRKLEDDHSSDRGDREEQDSPEPLEDDGNLDEEIAVFQILDRCSPGHVDADWVSEKCRQNVIRETAEEDEHIRDPDDVLLDQIEETVDLGSISCNDLGDISTDSEDNDDGYPNVEGRKEARQEDGIEPTLNEVESQGEGKGASNGIVRENVLAGRELVVNRGVAPQEGAEELRERTAVRPLPDPVENELRAAEGILLPSIELVVAGE